MFGMRNFTVWMLIFFLVSASGGFTSSVYAIEIYNNKKKAERERNVAEKAAREIQAQRDAEEGRVVAEKESQPVVIEKNTAPWTFGYYDRNTEEKIKFKELQRLLNSAPTNSSYKTRDIAYTTMGSLGAVLLGVGVLIPIGYKIKKEEIPKPAFATGMSLLGVGFITTTIFFSLRDLNRDKAVERYNEFVLGAQKKF